jgi:hypothetical protein
MQKFWNEYQRRQTELSRLVANSSAIKATNALRNRLYADYLMPSRLGVFEDIIVAARDNGYTQMSVRNFWEILRSGGPVPDKVVLRRHDIDTDLRTTRKLFEIERKHGIRSSFYFRLATLDLDLMHEIESYGSEASYHYEELATFAKRNHIKEPASVLKQLPKIRDEFLDNFQRIERQLGRKLRTVASHGDFANRRLKLNNTEVLSDPQLRADCGIECETYDSELTRHFDIYISDCPPPRYYRPIHPIDAIGHYKRIYLLTHPRQCATNWKVNTKDNIFRMYEGLRW